MAEYSIVTTPGDLPKLVADAIAENSVGTDTLVTITSTVTNNNAVANTLQDVTGLSFNVTAGTRYRFKFVIFYTAAATTYEN